MKSVVRLGTGGLVLLIVWGCSASRSTAYVDDTYLSTKDRARLLREKSSGSRSDDVDARADNYEGSERDSRRRDWDEDYCYSCRIRRYSTGVWYDPWFDPWWGWGWRSAWWGPSWGWWTPTWMVAPGWYYTPGWGWTYYAGYWGPTYYAGIGWSDWGAGWTPAPAMRYNYTPRTYTSPRGSTIYTPPRGISGGTATPPRRSAAPSPTPAVRSTPQIRSMPAPSAPRPSTSSGVTGGGNIRTSSGSTRPR